MRHKGAAEEYDNNIDESSTGDESINKSAVKGPKERGRANIGKMKRVDDDEDVAR